MKKWVLTSIWFAGHWDVPLPDDMDALIDGLLTDADMAPDSAFCSRAFQSELQAFLRAQVILLP